MENFIFCAVSKMLMFSEPFGSGIEALGYLILVNFGLGTKDKSPPPFHQCCWLSEHVQFLIFSSFPAFATLI